MADAGRLRHDRAARGARLSDLVASSRRCPTSATDDYGGSAGEPDALSAGGVRRDARGLAGGQADVGAHLGQRLGRRRRASRRTRRSRSPALFAAAGADIIDVSAGQTSTDAQPVYGRMFQTPFSDRIRNEAGIATMAVGNIYEADHVNSILMAGRADLVCLARPHLADPYWTLHAGGRDRRPRARLARCPIRPGATRLWRLADRAAETGGSGYDRAGRTSLITGGGTGVGAAIAPALAEAGRHGHDHRAAATAPLTRRRQALPRSAVVPMSPIAARCKPPVPRRAPTTRAGRHRDRQCRRGRQRAVRTDARPSDVHATAGGQPDRRLQRLAGGASRHEGRGLGPADRRRLDRRAEGLPLRRRPIARPSTGSSG